MMARRKPRWELVTTDAGIHVRFIAANGRIVLSSEPYTKRSHALRAIELVTGCAPLPYRDGLEVTVWVLVDSDGLLEVREVDERGAR